MSTQYVSILISVLALAIAIGSFLSSRQAAWSFRYFDRWAALAKIVLDHPATLFPLWCSRELYLEQYGSLQVDRAPDPLELVFVDLYADFVYEVNRRSRLFAFLSGRFPGAVPLSNPRARFIYFKYARKLYGERMRKVVDAALGPEG